MNDCKLLVFDFDGTLANTIPHIVTCILKCMDKFNLRKLTYEDVLKYNGAVLGNALKALGAKDEDLPKIKEYYTSIFFDDISDIHVYDKVVETLDNLKNKGCILTIASNRGRSTLIPLLEALQIDKYFDVIVCESDVENKKPSPDMVDLIIEKTNGDKSTTLVIGDTNFDVLMGKNAGCKTCLVDYENSVNVEEKPDYTIDDFPELIGLCK